MQLALTAPAAYAQEAPEDPIAFRLVRDPLGAAARRLGSAVPRDAPLDGIEVEEFLGGIRSTAPPAAAPRRLAAFCLAMVVFASPIELRGENRSASSLGLPPARTCPLTNEATELAINGHFRSVRNFNLKGSSELTRDWIALLEDHGGVCGVFEDEGDLNSGDLDSESCRDQI